MVQSAVATLQTQACPLLLGERTQQSTVCINKRSEHPPPGRLLFGHGSEAFMHPSSPFPLPRTVFLGLAAALSTLTTALLAAGPELHTLYILSLLAGLSFGGVSCMKEAGNCQSFQALAGASLPCLCADHGEKQPLYGCITCLHRALVSSASYCH